MNKKWLVLFLVFSLFPGCSEPATETAPSEVLHETKPTDPVGFSDVFVLSETEYPLQVSVLETVDANAFRFLGKDILVFSGRGTTLTLLNAEDLRVKAKVTLPQSISPANSDVTVGSRGITYVDKSSRELVFLNKHLIETERFPLPDEAESWAVAADQRMLYYATAGAFRVLDLETGIDRLIKTMEFPCQKLAALHCDDTVLQCSAIYDDEDPYTFFLSTETGKLLCEARDTIPLWTLNDRYFTIHMDGAYQELLTGTADSKPSALVTEVCIQDITPVLKLQSVLLHSQDPTGSTILNCYHLGTGLNTGRITLPKDYQILGIQPDLQEHALWLLCHDRNSGQDLLCRWDILLTDPKNSVCYLQPRYNPDHPDVAGLEQCKAFADMLSKKHSVRILIWKDATTHPPQNVELVQEHQVPLIRAQLEALDHALSCYPAGFLEKLAARTGSGRLNISLVRDIQRNVETRSGESSPTYPHWDDKGDIWLSVTSEQDPARQIHGQLFGIIDSRVLGLCSAYDNWDALNPPDFQYGSSQVSVELFTGENRYFVNLASTGSAHADRAVIMEYAMQENRQTIFAAAPMQAKLRQLCTGIREAFRLTRLDQPLPWEQYLDTPLTPDQ